MSEMNREKGAETGTTSCPTCGSELALAPQLDGSVAAEPCGTCYGKTTDQPQEQAVSSAPAPEPVVTEPAADIQPDPNAQTEVAP